MRRVVLLLAAATLALTGCAGADDGGGASAPSAGAGAIDGEWLLESGSDADGDFAPGLTPITLVLSKGAVAGQAPCNSYTGAVTDSGGTLAFSPIASTRMACADATATALETRYLSALQAVDAAEAGGGILTLTAPDATLRYVVAPAQSIN